MISFSRFVSALAFAACLPLGIASATPITASETIQDVPPFELFSRDLQRLRVDSLGQNFVENNDATIVAQNNVNNAFGIYGLGDVSYTHDLTWLNPAALSFLTATLTIQAYGPDFNDDTVFTDTIALGNLVVDGSLIFDSFTTSIFSFPDPVTLNVFLADGKLNVVIDKNHGANLPVSLDALSVYSSKLEVSYEPVPEPMTLSLIGLGALFAPAVRRRRSC